MLLVCGSASVYAFGGKGPGKAPDSKKQTAVRVERIQKAPELTEEQKAEISEKVKAELAEKLEAGTITQEEYDEYIAKLDSGEFPVGIRGRGNGFGGMEKPEASELTEEQKAEMMTKMQEKISTLLAKGEITQEQYDDYLAKINSGELPFKGMGGKGHGAVTMRKIHGRR